MFFRTESKKASYGRCLFRKKLESISDIRDIDSFLIRTRGYFESHPKYQVLLTKAKKLVLETGDESLLETLVIIFGRDLVDEEVLFQLAMSRMENSKIHKALYNAVREKVPEVKGYVGDGSSVFPW